VENNEENININFDNIQDDNSKGIISPREIDENECVSSLDLNRLNTISSIKTNFNLENIKGKEVIPHGTNLNKIK